MGTGVGAGIHMGWEPGYTRDGSWDGRQADPPNVPTVSSALLRNTPGFPGSGSPSGCSSRGDGALLLISLLPSSWILLGPPGARTRPAVTGPGWHQE